MLQVYKVFPYHPKLEGFNPFDSLGWQDMLFLKDNGFNVVRLYVAWPGVEPVRGQYNMSYLQVIINNSLCACFIRVKEYINFTTVLP